MLTLLSVFVRAYRIEFDSSNYEFIGVFVYGARGVVGGGESHKQR
jgi:hypothetical protein